MGIFDATASSTTRRKPAVTTRRGPFSPPAAAPRRVTTPPSTSKRRAKTLPARPQTAPAAKADGIEGRLGPPGRVAVTGRKPPRRQPAKQNGVRFTASASKHSPRDVRQKSPRNLPDAAELRRAVLSRPTDSSRRNELPKDGSEVKRKALASRARPGAAQRGGSHRAIAGRRGAVAPPPAQPAAAPPKGRELARTQSPPTLRTASPPKQRFQQVAKSPVSDIPRYVAMLRSRTPPKGTAPAAAQPPVAYSDTSPSRSGSAASSVPKLSLGPADAHFGVPPPGAMVRTARSFVREIESAIARWLKRLGTGSRNSTGLRVTKLVLQVELASPFPNEQTGELTPLHGGQLLREVELLVTTNMTSKTSLGTIEVPYSDDGAACLMPAIDASKSEIQLEEAEQLDGTRRSYLVFRLACEQRIVEAIDAIISRP